jgi:hypothetical protein
MRRDPQRATSFVAVRLHEDALHRRDLGARALEVVNDACSP